MGQIPPSGFSGCRFCDADLAKFRPWIVDSENAGVFFRANPAGGIFVMPTGRNHAISLCTFLITDIYIMINRKLDPGRSPGLPDVFRQPLPSLWIFAQISDRQWAEAILGISRSVAGYNMDCLGA